MATPPNISTVGWTISWGRSGREQSPVDGDLLLIKFNYKSRTRVKSSFRTGNFFVIKNATILWIHLRFYHTTAESFDPSPPTTSKPWKFLIDINSFLDHSLKTILQIKELCLFSTNHQQALEFFDTFPRFEILNKITIKLKNANKIIVPYPPTTSNLGILWYSFQIYIIFIVLHLPLFENNFAS